MNYFAFLHSFFKSPPSGFSDYSGKIKKTIFDDTEKSIEISLPRDLFLFPKFKTTLTIIDGIQRKWIYQMNGEKRRGDKIMLFHESELITIYLNEKNFGQWKGTVLLGSDTGKISIREISS